MNTLTAVDSAVKVLNAAAKLREEAEAAPDHFPGAARVDGKCPMMPGGSNDAE